jgi:hypothetical protein
LLECHDNNDELKQLHKEPDLIKLIVMTKNNNDEERTDHKLRKNILQNSLAKTKEGFQKLENNKSAGKKCQGWSNKNLLLIISINCCVRIKCWEATKGGLFFKKSRPEYPANTSSDILPSYFMTINSKCNTADFF